VPSVNSAAWRGGAGQKPRVIIAALRDTEIRTGDNLLSIIQAAGWPIWPLILCSVVALTIIIERLISLRPTLIAPNNLLDEVVAVTRTSLPGNDVVNKLAENSLLGGVFATGLRSVIAEPRITEEMLRQSFESAGRIALHRLERYLNTLGTIAATAPLLGLLGTVIGIIGAFNQLSGNRAELDLSDLGGDIGEALITTAAGITVALLTLLPYNLFRAQADRSLSRLESLLAAGLSPEGESH